MKRVQAMDCMNKRPQGRVADFLLRHRLCASAYDWEEQLDAFLREMDAVRAGASGSLKMIPTRLDMDAMPTGPVSVTAIDIGGTNVRSAIVTLNRNGVVRIERLPAFRTPGIGSRVSIQEFFRIIVAGVQRHLSANPIGI